MAYVSIGALLMAKCGEAVVFALQDGRYALM